MKTTKWMLPVLSIGLMCGSLCAADGEKAPAAVPAAAPVQEDIWAGFPEIFAVVDGKNITRDELKNILLSQMPDGKLPAGVTAELLQQMLPGMLRTFVDQQLLEKELEKNNIKVTPEIVEKEIRTEFEGLSPEERNQFEQQLKMQGSNFDNWLKELVNNPMTQKQIAVKQLMDKKVFAALPKVTDEDAKKFYTENIQQFQKDAMVRVSHILYAPDEKATDKEAADKAALEKAIGTYKKLQENPAQFEEIAKNESVCPSGKEGGKLDPYPAGKGVMVREFDEAVMGIDNTGKIVGPVKTQFGYHLIRLDEKIPASTVPFEEVKKNLVSFLNMQKQQAAFAEYMKNLHKEYKVEFKLPMPQAPVMPGM